MFLGRVTIISIIVAALGAAVSVAMAADGDAISTALQVELAKRYDKARIELTDEIHWTSSRPEGEVESIRVGEANARGQAGITVETRDENGIHRGYGYATFSAWMPARVAVRRVMPGERLQDDQFSNVDVDVATGVNRDLRGVIYGQGSKISSLQARQTILEGQPLLSSAVERVPDVRRGDPVRVQIISNGLVLSAQAVASEPGYLNNSLRVLTDITKRELSGKLVAGGVVEVRL